VDTYDISITGAIPSVGTCQHDYLHWDVGSSEWISGGSEIAIGCDSGIGQQNFAISIGDGAGGSGQKSNSIAIGKNCGILNQSSSSCAIGFNSASNNQGTKACSYGVDSGFDDQGSHSCCYGNGSGNSNLGLNACAYGKDSGRTDAGEDSCSYGRDSGGFNLGARSTAYGTESALANCGVECISLGYQAGNVVGGQPSNSFHIGTTNIRDSIVAGTAKNLQYDSSTGEIYTDVLPSSSSFKIVSPVTISLNADYTYLASDFLSGIILRNPASNDVDDETPDASSIIAAITSPQLNLSFEVTIYNISNKEVKEINPGAGVTFIVPTGVTDWKIKKDEARTVTVVITALNPGGTVDMYSTRHHQNG